MSKEAMKQEPVAWQDTANHMELVSAEDWENIDPMWHWMYRPLYTSPPTQQEPVAAAWDEGYRQGVEDERTSEANIGYAGFGAKVEPARQNPYGTTPAQQEPVAWATYLGECAHVLWGKDRPDYPIRYEVPLYTSQPAQQEPVAKSLLVSLYTTGYKDGHHDTVEGQYIDVHQSEMDTYHLDVVANWLEDNLIAQRTWVGLTEEERSKIESEVLMRGENYPEVLAAIEAKLKEKNA